MAKKKRKRKQDNNNMQELFWVHSWILKVTREDTHGNEWQRKRCNHKRNKERDLREGGDY